MASPAMPRGEEFQPEAAIVNYFGPSDMLGGHVDDMEADWSKPIVSISLGCKAVFLLGGKSREDLPIAMFMRSGDIVLMAGQARECFHGLDNISLHLLFCFNCYFFIWVLFIIVLHCFDPGIVLCILNINIQWLKICHWVLLLNYDNNRDS